MQTSRPQIHNPVIKDTATFLDTSAESGGERTVLEIELAPGGGNPLHVHRSYEERFNVVAGLLGVQIGSEKLILEAGEHAVVQRGTPHRFFSGDDHPCTFTVTITPGHAGFEKALCIMYGLAADGRTNEKGIPKNPVHLAVAGVMSDMELPGAMRLLNPVFHLLARLARAGGLEDELIARYASVLPR